jgi:GAF domain-containing protein
MSHIRLREHHGSNTFPGGFRRSKRNAQQPHRGASDRRTTAVSIGATKMRAQEKQTLYGDLAAQLTGLLEGESDPIANAANTAALIYHGLPGLNWAGFYYRRGDELLLGPFQGKPACVRIPWGKGVCGTAGARRRSVVVPDVHAFPGHIACDPNSRSELVVPLLQAGELLGVIDLDSPRPARFDEDDRIGVERLAAILIASLGPR